MASILFQFQPDGPTDAHTGEREGFARLDELIETRREELGIEPFGEYGDQ